MAKVVKLKVDLARRNEEKKRREEEERLACE